MCLQRRVSTLMSTGETKFSIVSSASILLRRVFFQQTVFMVYHGLHGAPCRYVLLVIWDRKFPESSIQNRVILGLKQPLDIVAFSHATLVRWGFASIHFLSSVTNFEVLLLGGLPWGTFSLRSPIERTDTRYHSLSMSSYLRCSPS